MTLSHLLLYLDINIRKKGHGNEWLCEKNVKMNAFDETALDDKDVKIDALDEMDVKRMLSLAFIEPISRGACDAKSTYRRYLTYYIPMAVA